MSDSGNEIRRRTLLRFERILVSKYFQRFVDIFVSQDRNEKLCKGKLLFFRKKPGIEKNLCIRGGISRFSIKICVSHSAKNFQKVTLLFLRSFFRFRTVLWMERGISHTFFVEKIRSHIVEKFRGQPFNDSEVLGYQKILCKYHVFWRKIFGLTCRKKL